MNEMQSVTSQQNEQHYSLLIEWSEQDQAYVVSFPEWERAGYIVHAHGDTYAQAIEAGQELLDFMVQSAEESGEILPEPKVYAGA